MNKRIILGFTILIFLLGILLYSGIQYIASWFNLNEIVFNQIVKIEFKTPFEIKKREPIVKEIVLDYP